MTRLKKAKELNPELTNDEILESCPFETLKLTGDSKYYCSDDEGDCKKCWSEPYEEDKP